MRLHAEEIAAVLQSFQSTHPAWGATIPKPNMGFYWDISIHAPRVGCDTSADLPVCTSLDFNPRTPRGVRRHIDIDIDIPIDFNPRTPRGVRHAAARVYTVTVYISIHAPRVGCDTRLQPAPLAPWIISIHAPRVGCDDSAYISIDGAEIFQSTHPAWGATKVATC